MSEEQHRQERQREQETPAEGHGFEGDHITAAWGKEPPAEVRAMEELKDALITQHHEYHFGGPDPSDGLTDDEIWASLPESFRPHEGR